jgi:hypothetical protein
VNKRLKKAVWSEINVRFEAPPIDGTAGARKMRIVKTMYWM